MINVKKIIQPAIPLNDFSPQIPRLDFTCENCGLKAGSIKNKANYSTIPVIEIPNNLTIDVVMEYTIAS
jgi:hypothetical protein